MTDYTETIKSFIMNEMISQKTEIILSDSDSLIEQGIIDSLGVQILIAYLEKEFDVSIVDNEIVPENFETIASVAKLIHSKLIR